MNSLRVATFNTLFPNALEHPGTWTWRSELIRRAIQRAHPDVIGLQEVLPATLAELPRLLGALSFVAGPDRGPARAFSPYPLLESTLRLVRTGTLRTPEGSAREPVRNSAEYLPIAYRADRLKPLESGAFWISATPAQPATSPPTAFSPSMVHWVRFAQLENAESLLVMNAHIGHAPWHHALAVRTLTERIRALSPAGPRSADPPQQGEGRAESVFVLGDFNALRSSWLIRALTSPGGAALVDSTRAAAQQSGPPVTFHWGVGATRWGVSIDYVLAATVLRATSCERIGEREGSLYASDHHLTLVEFRAL